MEGDPFVILAQKIKQPPRNEYVHIGKVVSVSPLQIDLAGNKQEKEDLLVNPEIKELKTGDKVLLISTDEKQQFAVVCKVVEV